MPRFAGQAIPKYREHRASGQAICTIHGRDHYLGAHGTKASRLEYDRIIAEWLVAGRNPVGISADELTIAELCVRYLKFASKYYQRHGECTGETPAVKAMMRTLRPLYGRQRCCEFGPLALKAVRQQFVGEGLSRSYANAQTARIKRMFKWGVEEQIVSAGVFQALSAVSGLRRGKTEARETAPVLPVDDATVEATLQHLPNVVADMVRLQRATGMRPAEVCILRPCDVDRSGDVWTYQPVTHKTERHGRERIIFFGPKAQGVLLRYLARDAQSYCFRPCDSEAKRLAEQESKRKTPKSCGNVRGSNVVKRPKKKPSEKYTTDSYRRSIHYACDKAGIERWSPNRLRHSAATEIRKRFGLEAAQVTLGHASADITQVYAERDNTLAIQVAREVG